MRGDLQWGNEILQLQQLIQSRFYAIAGAEVKVHLSGGLVEFGQAHRRVAEPIVGWVFAKICRAWYPSADFPQAIRRLMKAHSVLGALRGGDEVAVANQGVRHDAMDPCQMIGGRVG